MRYSVIVKLYIQRKVAIRKKYREHHEAIVRFDKK